MALTRRTRNGIHSTNSSSADEMMDESVLTDDLSNTTHAAADGRRRAKEREHDSPYIFEGESGAEDANEPPKKRSRTAEESGPSRSKGGKSKRVTVRELMKTFFEILPLDVVYEIFGSLHPRDLLMLARTSKMLRGVLVARSAVSVWKDALSTVEGIPECPQDQTPMQWTQLMFFTDCMICWKHNKIRNIDWTMRLRACETCSRANLIHGPVVRKRFRQLKPEDVDSALALLPHSKKRTWAGGVPPGSPLYYLPSVSTMLEALREHNIKIHKGVLGAREALEAFKTRKQQESKEINDSVPGLQKWMSSNHSEKAVTKVETSAARTAAVRVKLLELGYDARDIEEMLWQASTGGPLTERSWKTCRTRYVRYVQQAKAMRLDREFRSIVGERKMLVKELYSDYRAHLCEPEHSLTPRSYTVICGLAPFKQILESDGAVIVTKESFSDAMTGLPSLVEEWTNARKMVLLEKLAGALSWPPLPPLNTINKTQNDEAFAKLENLTSAFICGDPPLGERRVLYAVDIRRHDCSTQKRWGYKPPEPTLKCLVVDLQAVSAVGKLARLLGLDPENATPAEMDDINARFYCQQCPLVGEAARWARTWRQCATHHLDHPVQSVPQGWIRLAKDEEEAIIALENGNSVDPVQRMICHHCSDDDARVSYSRLQNHMQLRHQRDSVTSDDYHPDPSIPAQPLALPLAPRSTAD